MRKIGGDLTEEHAGRFADYLFTEGILTVVEQSTTGQFELWAKNEDQLDQAKQQLAAFRLSPDDAKFKVDRQAEALRRQKEKENREKLRLQQSFKPKAVPGIPGAGAAGGMATRATIGIIAICVVTSLLTSFGERPRLMEVSADEPLPISMRIYDSLTLLPMAAPEDAGPMWAVMKGQAWRLITPIFLHGGMLHLAFNCLFVFFFGRVVESIFGPRLFIALFILGGVLGILAQAYGPIQFGGSPHVIGASGGALALFSFLWLRPMLEPTIPFRIPPLNVALILGMVIISMTSVGPLGNDVANLAHLGGLVMGAIAAAGALDVLRR